MSRHRVDVLRSATPLLAAAIMSGLVGCSEASNPPMPATEPAAATLPSPERAPSNLAPPPPESHGAQPDLASDPAQVADDLVADERALRDPSSSQEVLSAAARRQQTAYRLLGRHPEWDPIVRPRIPPPLLQVFDLNIDARRHLTALNTGHASDTLPAWRINPPTPADELMRHYREAQAASGIDWTYLAAINMIETAFGRIDGLSSAGAQGPMQFMPSTFAAYGEGGDINAPRDSILAAGRYLAANGFAHDRDHALYRYNNSNDYVQAVNDYATVLASDPAAFGAYHRWDVYYVTAAGDVLLPVGYEATSRIPVADYLASHPQ